jgi:hypothetical protein
MPAGRAPVSSGDPYFPRPAEIFRPIEARPSTKGRPAGNGIYLPPMPEMLQPPPAGSGTARPKPADPRSPQTPAPAAMTPLYTKTPTPVPPKANADAATIRAQTPDEKPFRPLPGQGRIVIPTAEELGLNRIVQTPGDAANPVTFDWNAVKNQMKLLGASHYRLENEANGSVRFVCALPHPDNPNKHRQFEARAMNEQDAYRLAWEQARAWKQSLKQQDAGGANRGHDSSR